MAKQLVVNPDKCVGCRTCELMCSFGHFGQFNPRMSAVAVMDYEYDALSVPIMCLQCDDGTCATVCPMGALVRTAEGVMSYDEGKCIKCKMCMFSCPLGNIHYTPIAGQMIKCDLCGGDPKCVRFCHAGALTIVDDCDIPDRKRAAADAMAASMRKGGQ